MSVKLTSVFKRFWSIIFRILQAQALVELVISFTLQLLYPSGKDLPVSIVRDTEWTDPNLMTKEKKRLFLPGFEARNSLRH